MKRSSEFRKLAIPIYAANDNEIVRLGGPISSMKKFIKKLLDSEFRNNSEEFEAKNQALIDIATSLHESFRNLESAVDRYDLIRYQTALDDVKSRMNDLNTELAKIHDDVVSVKDKAKNDYFIQFRKKDPGKTDEAKILTNPETEVPVVETEENKSHAPVDTLATPYAIPFATPDDPAAEEKATTPDASNLQMVTGPAHESTEENKMFKYPSLEEHIDWNGKSFSEIPELSLMNLSKITIRDTIPETVRNKIQDKSVNLSKIESSLKTAIMSGKLEKWKPANAAKFKDHLYGQIKVLINRADFSDESGKIPLTLQAYLLLDGTLFVSNSILETGKPKHSERMNFIQSFRKTAKTHLPDSFFVSLNEMCKRLGIAPELILPAMYLESHVSSNPFDGKNKHYSGLLQINNSYLPGLGFKGSVDEFRSLPEEEQLVTVEKHIRQQLAHGAFKSPAHYYVSNLLPDALNYKKYFDKYKGQPGWWPADYDFHDVNDLDPAAVIVEKDPQFRKSPNFDIEKEKEYYRKNSGLDLDHDGKITLGDFNEMFKKKEAEAPYQEILKKVKEAPNYQETQQQGSVPERFKETPTSAPEIPELRAVLDKLGLEDLPANDSFLSHLSEKLQSIANHRTIRIVSRDRDVNAEFAQLVWHSLRHDFGRDPKITCDDDAFEVSIGDPLSSSEMIDLCASINRDLYKYSGVNVRCTVAVGLPIGKPFELHDQLRCIRAFCIKSASKSW